MNNQQAGLLLKAQDSLRAAEILADQGFYDFAVSRAYYTMFYVAEAILLGEDLSFSSHSAVISAFGQLFTKTGKAPEMFHRYLIDGHDSRIVGDYDAGPGLSQHQAVEQIERAEQFLELAERLIGPIPPGDKRKS